MNRSIPLFALLLLVACNNDNPQAPDNGLQQCAPALTDIPKDWNDVKYRLVPSLPLVEELPEAPPEMVSRAKKSATAVWGTIHNWAGAGCITNTQLQEIGMTYETYPSALSWIPDFEGFIDDVSVGHVYPGPGGGGPNVEYWFGGSPWSEINQPLTTSPRKIELRVTNLDKAPMDLQWIGTSFGSPVSFDINGTTHKVYITMLFHGIRVGP